MHRSRRVANLSIGLVRLAGNRVRRCLPSQDCVQLGLVFQILFENSDSLLEALEFDRLLLGTIRELASFDAS
jgi:hypothetical protein